MTDRIPVKAIFASGNVVAMGEYGATDTINASYINGIPTAVNAQLSTLSVAIDNAMTAIATEASDRAAAISSAIATEVTNRNAAIATAVSAETTARTTADGTLQTNINTVTSNLSTEVTNRTNADTALQNSIDAEITNRINADTSLVQNLYGKNFIINGNFDIWQRNNSFTISGGGEAYGADRWIHAVLNGNHAVNRAGDANGTGAPSGYEQTRYWHRSVISGVGSTTSAWMGQRIESVTTLAGQTATVSFLAYGPVNGKIGVRMLQYFGTGGSPSSTVSLELGVTTLASGWNVIKYTFTLPSIAGKTLGTNGNDYLYFVIDYCQPSSIYGGALLSQSGTFGVTKVQIEKGSNASVFEYRNLALELALCQRYYETSYAPNFYPGDLSAAPVRYGGTCFLGNTVRASIQFRVQKRISPALTFYRSSVDTSSGFINSWSAYNGGAWSAHASVGNSLSIPNHNGFQVDTNTTFSTTVGFTYLVSGLWTADAEVA